MTLTIKKEAPKVKLVTVGKADKEIKMGKEPEYHLPPGATEPVQKIPEASGMEVISKEPANKPGPVGAKGEPRKAEEKKTEKKK